MGLAMVEHIQLVREKYNFNELDMRIGIHTGTVIGGIIGTEIVRYDIYGPHVMIANKFE
jgi:class 3 adenylate cyclase